jgi:dihydrodipicolinate synthase/N-acetylneuraminate lyase
MVKDARDIVKGVCTLAELPFTTDGAVDYNAFEKLVDFLAGTGADGVGLWAS